MVFFIFLLYVTGVVFSCKSKHTGLDNESEYILPIILAALPCLGVSETVPKKLLDPVIKKTIEGKIDFNLLKKPQYRCLLEIHNRVLSCLSNYEDFDKYGFETLDICCSKVTKNVIMKGDLKDTNLISKLAKEMILCFNENKNTSTE
jgi:hypothetical protein